ncbi:MAG: GatB/YqeY domain-containing protein [Alphaproteobacteria bacterium]|nr:GatB/YqeY domain-containing protein [Alphaproteobacteria bacterium]
MALKDRLTDALNATPSDNTRRIETIQEVLAASGGGTDVEVQAALTKMIADREQKAATFSAAGQSEMAKTERFEIDALRGFLRYATPEAPAAKAARPPKAAAVGAAAKAPAGPVVSRTQIIIAAVAAVIVVAALLVYKFVLVPPSDENMLANGTGAVPMTIYKDDRTLGNPKAPITMIEYAAPTCPHCAHFSMTVMPLIKQNYIDTGKVYYVFRVFPLNPADGAVEAIARCLPADKYFHFIDLMFRNQSKWDPDGYQIADVHAAIVQMARTQGMDQAQVDQCITNKDEQDRINQIALDGETKYNIQGTPTFVINGTIVQVEEADWPQLKARFDSLLSKH